MAMQCSKPAATNAADGRDDGENSVDVRACAVRHPYPQADQSIAHDSERDRRYQRHEDLCIAVPKAISPTEPPPELVLRRQVHQPGSRDRADKIAGEHNSQFSKSRVFTLPLAQAMTIRLLPVNSSAPPTTTKISPSEKDKPTRRRPAHRAVQRKKRRLRRLRSTVMLPALTVVANIAPKAMNAPARMLSTRRLKGRSSPS